jgi:uncharacterized membrane protein YgdD (TMEM256/DUF423 family)
MSRLAILLGAGNAAVAIILGAFAAHALKNSLDQRMINVFNTAVDYHLYHSLGLIVVGLLINHLHISNKVIKKSKALHASVYLMTTGIIIFCGSLYALSLTGITKFGMITPIGGITFIAAWLLVLVAFINKTSTS